MASTADNNQAVMEPSTIQANRIMQEANHIIQDFSIGEYGIYLALFLAQTAFFFWLGVVI